MNFIEQFLGIAPDGGSGTTELAYVIPILLVVATCCWNRLRKSTRIL